MDDMGHGGMGGGGHDMSSISHGAMAGGAMAGMDHSGHDMSSMAGGAMAGGSMAGMDHGAGGMQEHPASETGNPLVDMQTMAPAPRLDDPGIGLRDNGRRVPTYADLRRTDRKRVVSGKSELESGDRAGRRVIIKKH